MEHSYITLCVSIVALIASLIVAYGITTLLNLKLARIRSIVALLNDEHVCKAMSADEQKRCVHDCKILNQGVYFMWIPLLLIMVGCPLAVLMLPLSTTMQVALLLVSLMIGRKFWGERKVIPPHLHKQSIEISIAALTLHLTDITREITELTDDDHYDQNRVEQLIAEGDALIEEIDRAKKMLAAL